MQECPNKKLPRPSSWPSRLSVFSCSIPCLILNFNCMVWLLSMKENKPSHCTMLMLLSTDRKNLTTLFFLLFLTSVIFVHYRVLLYLPFFFVYEKYCNCQHFLKKRATVLNIKHDSLNTPFKKKLSWSTNYLQENHQRGFVS